MSYKIIPKKFKALLEASNEDRYFHAVAKIVDLEELFALKDDQGWFFAETKDGDVYFPIWCHPDFATKTAAKHAKGYSVEAIDLELFMNVWLPGMANDGVKVSIFPNMDWESMMLDAAVVLEDIKEQYEFLNSDNEAQLEAE